MMNNGIIRTYSELISIPSLKERFDYLKLNGTVGISTFGFDRWLNQRFYKSYEWKRIRDQIIIRDYGCELGVKDYPIQGSITIHHMNPVLVEDIYKNNELIMNPEYLICCSHRMHNAVHYSDNSIFREINYVERKPNDTCPWRK